MFPNSNIGKGLAKIWSIPLFIAFSMYSYSTWPVIATILIDFGISSKEL